MNPSKQKGTAFETAVVRYLQETWPEAERRALAGNQDMGDVAGVPGWVLELKATREINLAAAVDEADKEAANAWKAGKGSIHGAPWFAAIIKRRNKAVDQSYVVMPLWELVGLLQAMDGK